MLIILRVLINESVFFIDHHLFWKTWSCIADISQTHLCLRITFASKFRISVVWQFANQIIFPNDGNLLYNGICFTETLKIVLCQQFTRCKINYISRWQEPRFIGMNWDNETNITNINNTFYSSLFCEICLLIINWKGFYIFFAQCITPCFRIRTSMCLHQDKKVSLTG